MESPDQHKEQPAQKDLTWNPIESDTLTNRLRTILLSDGNMEQKHLIKFLRQLAIKEAPALAEVQVCEDTHDDEVAAMIVPMEEDKPLQIAIGNSFPGEIQRFMERRPRTVELISDLLGISVDKITVNSLMIFAVMHELGHALDFIEHYRKPLEEAGDEHAHHHAWSQWWSEKRNPGYGWETLPIPYMPPSSLITTPLALWKVARLRKASAKIIELAKISPDTVLRMQEDAYKSLEREKQADSFAAKVMKKYLLD